MSIERVEKILPLSLISICLLGIILRVSGVMPPIVATDEFEISRTIFIDAGIGGLLAVFAIVISLTLMGIQFASQEYTHRVMNTYLQSFMLWAMMGSYLFTVLFNLYMTAFIQKPINTVYADISIMLQSLCLILLIPHFIFAVFHLKPDYTIHRLIGSVDMPYLTSIKEFINKGKSNVPHKIDRLLPAIEIVEKSIERGDRATVRVGLEKLLECYSRYVNSSNEDWLSRYFLDYLLRIGRESVIEADDDSIVQVLDILGEIGQRTVSLNVVNLVVNNIRNIGNGALKKEYDAAVEQMIDSLYNILTNTANIDAAQQIIVSLGEIVRQLFHLEKKQLILYLTNRLSRLTETTVLVSNLTILKQWVGVLEDIGHLAIKQNMQEVIHVIIRVMYQIGITVAKQNQEMSNYIIESLVRIEQGIVIKDRGLFSEINYAKQEIQKIQNQYTPKTEEQINIDTSDLW